MREFLILRTLTLGKIKHVLASTKLNLLQSEQFNKLVNLEQFNKLAIMNKSPWQEKLIESGAQADGSS